MDAVARFGNDTGNRSGPPPHARATYRHRPPAHTAVHTASHLSICGTSSVSDGRSKSPSLTMLATGKTSFKTSLAFHYSDIHWQSPASAVAIIDGAPGYSLPPRGRLAKNEPPHYLHGGKPPVNVSLKASASMPAAAAQGPAARRRPPTQWRKPPNRQCSAPPCGAARPHRQGRALSWSAPDWPLLLW